MLVLALDTATPAMSVAVVEVPDAAAGVRRGGGAAADVLAVAQRHVVDARAHAELLAPSVAGVLGDAGVEGRDLAAVVVGRGPGPYTGLRVGMVTAATYAWGLGVPVYGVCSLDGLRPRRTPGAAPGSPSRWASVVDARRREVYWAVYEDLGGGAHRVVGPEVALAATVGEQLAAAGAVAAVGAGAEMYADVLGMPVSGPAYPDPTVLAGLAASRIRDSAPSEPPEPMYLRRPDAQAPGPRKRVLPGRDPR